MKFGLFFEHQLPKPWSPDGDRLALENALEQCELADRLGVQYCWVVEHHFLEEYSHSSAPEIFLGALSQRTRRMRMGHGIVQVPPPFNHPVRVAERIATLDLLSNGRAEFGTGESSSEAELGGFGIDPHEKRAMAEEGLRVALRCLTETPFTGHAGKYVSVPPRNVVPKPQQKPHPPVWVACTRRETIHRAAQLGIGALTFAFFDPEEARHWVADYRQTLERECVPIGDAVNASLACVTMLSVHPDEREAIARGAEGANFLGYSLGHYYVFGRHRPGNTDLWHEFQQQRAAVGYDPGAVEASGGALGARAGGGERPTGLRGAIGTPEQVRDYLRRYEDFGVDQVILACQTGRNRHEHVMESLERFGREILPEFIERDARASREKQRELEPAIARALARKPASDHPPLPTDYAFPAIPRSQADREQNDGFHRWLDEYARSLASGEEVAKRLASARRTGEE
jgi:alkanesulfonate monooxygenase SsuD/methylene tetrahydromethanopterin reductase-like flavin-dependent oxidoreductase (luciferase family)